MATPFATHVEYTERGYDASRFATATVLDARLAAASRFVRSRCRDIDVRIADGSLDGDLVTDVVCAMVARTVPSDGMEGVSSVQQAAGPFSRTTTLSNPGGDLYLTKGEKVSLGCGTSRAWSVDLTQPVEVATEDAS